MMCLTNTHSETIRKRSLSTSTYTSSTTYPGGVKFFFDHMKMPPMAGMFQVAIVFCPALIYGHRPVHGRLREIGPVRSRPEYGYAQCSMTYCAIGVTKHL